LRLTDEPKIATDMSALRQESGRDNGVPKTRHMRVGEDSSRLACEKTRACPLQSSRFHHLCRFISREIEELHERPHALFLTAGRKFDTVEVRSSSLLVPTIFFNHLRKIRSFPAAPLRSNKGLNGCNHWFSPRAARLRCLMRWPELLVPVYRRHPRKWLRRDAAVPYASARPSK
jgi:hypothetical protein